MVEVAPSTSLRMMTRQGGEFWKYHYKQNARPARSHVQLVVDEANPMRDCLVWKDVGDRYGSHKKHFFSFQRLGHKARG